MDANDPRHGTTAGYHQGCRLDCCKQAIGRYEKHKKHRLRNGEKWAIPAIGTQRRIKALMALGWTADEIARAAGRAGRNWIFVILKGQNGRPCTWVQRKTRDNIARVYDQLSMTPPPPGPHRTRVRNAALRKGYAPPLAWTDIDDPNDKPQGVVGWNNFRDPNSVDPMVVERILGGDWRMDCTRAEKEQVCARFMAAGGSSKTLGELCGWKIDRYWRRSDAA